MRRKIFKIFLLLAALAAIALVVSLLFPAPLRRPVKPFPNPNGYDAFVKAGQMLPANLPDVQKLNHDELAAVVEANSNALQMVRVGLQQECRVPVQFSEAFNSNHISDLSVFKQLTRAIAAEGTLAEMENRPADAAKSCLDILRLGQNLARGGITIDGLVSIAIEGIGIKNLEDLKPHLDALSCRETAGTLETLDAGRETWADIVESEHHWKKHYPWSFRQRFSDWMNSAALGQSINKAALRFNELQKRTRRLMIDLAARAYELDKGERPKSIGDLVPGYLKAIPLDPLTGTNMVYPP